MSAIAWEVTSFALRPSGELAPTRPALPPPGRAIRYRRLEHVRSAVVMHAHAVAVDYAPRSRVVGMDVEAWFLLGFDRKRQVRKARVQEMQHGGEMNARRR